MQSIPEVTVGVDLGDRKSVLCVINAAGQLVKRQTISTTEPAFEHFFSSLSPARVVLEAGTHSPWTSRLLQRQGHEVLVANPAVLHRKGRNKTDRIDAEQLARWGRADPKLLAPLQLRFSTAARPRKETWRWCAPVMRWFAPALHSSTTCAAV